MRKPLFVVRNDDTGSATIYLYGVIGDYWNDGDPITATRFMQQLTALEGKYKVVNVRINSPGGDVWEGLAICNAIKSAIVRGLEVHTWNDGLCASMAAVILASAKNGARHAAKGSITMIHNALTGVWGNSADLRETADSLDVHDNVLITFFVDATGLSAEEVKKKWFDFKNHWLTADEAAECGLVVIESYDSEPVPENIKDMSMQKVAAFYNPKIAINNNDDMFGNKFKNLTALAKVAAAGPITAEHVKAVNEEILAEKIPGVTLVLDSELEVANAAAVENSSLRNQLTEKDGKIEKLTNEVAALQAKLDSAADDGGTPPAGKTDETPGDGKDEKPDFSTSVDAELKAIYG